MATRLRWLRSLGFISAAVFLGFLDSAAVVLIAGNEHNALGQGLMLGLNWLRFAWFLHLLHALFWATAFWSLFG